ncbi:MAG: flagellar biosynthesis protein FlhB [Rhodospirillales bacterium]|nr:flagellar biosynthesis protein FlhB [Rhodospirillales bacterium]
MADEDADESQKTEQPSGRKLGRARTEGNVPMSQEVKIWLMLLGTTVIVGWLGSRMAVNLLPTLTRFVESPHTMAVDPAALQRLFVGLAIEIGLVLLIPFSFLFLLGVLGTIGQVGFLWVGKRLLPDFSKLNPLAGLKRLFSPMSLIEFLKATIKLVVVGTILWTIVEPRQASLPQMVELDPLQMLGVIREVVFTLAATTLGVYTFVAGADYVYQRWTFMKRLRMTKQEVKDENKETEGDPKIKAKLASLRMQRARARMMAAVPKATVVVTNPTHYAIALHYDMETMPAPQVVAKGVDFLALRIRELAEAHEVPLVENPPLARALYAAVEVDETIPPEHYKAVAEVIGYVMRLKKKL